MDAIEIREKIAELYGELREKNLKLPNDKECNYYSYKENAVL
jgi:hypothetical protein